MNTLKSVVMKQKSEHDRIIVYLKSFRFCVYITNRIMFSRNFILEVKIFDLRVINLSFIKICSEVP